MTIQTDIRQRNRVPPSLFTFNIEPRLARAAGPMGRRAVAPGRSAVSSYRIRIYVTPGPSHIQIAAKVSNVSGCQGQHCNDAADEDAVVRGSDLREDLGGVAE